MTLRVRFAPSPTGFLHVGGARTALFNWLLARKEDGVFVLRVEDTDRERSREEHTEAILHGLRWLGLDWDEGPFFQREGLERHEAHALALLESGRAYRDFSTPEEAARDRELDQEAGKRLRRARERARARTREEEEALLQEGRPFALRFMVPPGETVWKDRVHGETRFRNEEIDDLVILRSDGTPTYNLAVVSDDLEMGINLVLRGDDHLSNTPKQILLCEALGHQAPDFAHVPLILGPDGKRLSKRHGATAVGDYEGRGILPEAMVNFLALLGWSPGDDREVFSREELVEAFSLERVLKKSSVFDSRKLEWLNGQHLARMATDVLLDPVARHLIQEGLLPSEASEVLEGGSVPPEDLPGLPVHLPTLVGLLKVRARTLAELATQARPYLLEELEFDPAAVKKHWAKDPETALARLEALEEVLEGCPWEEEALEKAIRGLAGRLDVGLGKVIHPLRVAVTGRMSSPGMFEVLVLLGRERSLRRLRAGIQHLRADNLPGEGRNETLS